jgi:ABC-type glycerol-3-phosphate transport system permease component
VGSSARATPLPETKPAARAATIASFIFMYTVFLVSVLFASGRDRVCPLKYGVSGFVQVKELPKRRMKFLLTRFLTGEDCRRGPKT